MVCFNDLTEEQKNTIRQTCPDPENATVEEMWQCFLETENDPDEVLAIYRALFDPEYATKMDVFDHAWGILIKLNPTGFNSAYAQVLAMTGRVGELSRYLEEFKNGLPEKK